MGLFIFVGLLTALSLGPTSYSVLRQYLQSRRLPWTGLLGMLVADLFYVALGLALVKTSWLQNLQVQTFLQLVTAGALLIFAAQGLRQVWRQSGRQALESQGQESYCGFRKTFVLTMANPNVLMIYLSLLITVKELPVMQQLGLMFVFLTSFFLSLLSLARLLLVFRNWIRRYRLWLETAICCGFIFYGGKLIWGVL